VVSLADITQQAIHLPGFQHLGNIWVYIGGCHACILTNGRNSMNLLVQSLNSQHSFSLLVVFAQSVFLDFHPRNEVVPKKYYLQFIWRKIMRKRFLRREYFIDCQIFERSVTVKLRNHQRVHAFSSRLRIF
jgi:hypothetical protein